MRCLRAGFVTPHSGGLGNPPVRHYDRAARSSLIKAFGAAKTAPMPGSAGPKLSQA